MPSITIRNLDQQTKDLLRLRAAHHKRSMEEEARIILKVALAEKASPGNLADSIAEIVRPLGGIELELPDREPAREPPPVFAMIVVDTNVVSELMKSIPDEAVRAWSNRHSASTLYTTSITEAEILYGIELMPDGKRRRTVRAAAEEIFGKSFAGRVLPFGRNAASAYSRLMARRRGAGKPKSQADGQIAAIALSAGASLATRNDVDFDGLGLKVINPWGR